MKNCLVLNPGSSTLKSSLYRGDSLLSSCQFEIARENRAGQGGANGVYAQAVDATLATMSSQACREDQIDVIAYRVVHGGTFFQAPTLLDAASVCLLKQTIDLAPLHQPPAFETIEFAMKRLPAARHVACFDTAFHATLPEVEKYLPIPRSHYEAGIRRYGFHGLSYQSIVDQIRREDESFSRGRCVVCHLGSGASVCGIKDGISQWTSMSFTPQDGLIMGTRSGRLDPGVILHWWRSGWTLDQVESTLTKKSGLLGISGSSSDMRTLLRERDEKSESAQAIEMFCRAVAREVTSAATAIGGIDALIFTAGIGEHCSAVRSRIVQLLDWIGGKLDPVANEENQRTLHHSDSSFAILRMETDEQRVIAALALQTVDDATNSL